MPQLSPPGPIPRIDNTTFRADARHHLNGRMGHAIKLLVCHATETQALGNAPSGPWLSTDPASTVSTHHLYARDGTRYDLVNRVDTAYHAGVSAWGPWHGDVDGVSLINLVSIGHELESTARLGAPGTGYTPAQLYTLAYTLAGELFSYGLDWAAVVTHAQIAPGRKHDPAYLDLAMVQRRVAAWLAFLRSLPAADVARWIV